MRLTMVAGSALTLAVSWLGVVQADRAQSGASMVAMEPAAVVAVEPAPVVPASDGTLIPAPARRQVVVVRRSQAS